MIQTSKFKSVMDFLLIGLLFILVVGTPLLFTSLTRSVFEVNKLLLLRIVTILTYTLWLFKYLVLKANDEDNEKNESISILGLRWKKIGLEIPIILWLIFNLLSTVFSQNIKISIIGAYDRWEGIVTVVNYLMLFYMYAKLVTKRVHFGWLMAGILIPAGISGVYGVYQSVGWDFMHWSVDPTKRVFACINNPVHFCAYVGMIVPMGLAWLLYLSKTKPTLDPYGISGTSPSISPFWKGFKWSIFALTLLVINLRIDYLDLSIWQIDMSFAFDWKINLALVTSWFLALNTPQLIPTPTVLVKWFVYAALVLGCNMAGFLEFSRELWITYFFMVAVQFIVAPIPNAGIASKRGILFLTCLIFYTQYLSFSRATWMGFIGSITMFYLMITESLNFKNTKTFSLDWIITGLGIGVFYMTYIFKLHQKGLIYAVIVGILMVAFTIYNYLVTRDNNSFISFKGIDREEAILALSICMVLFVTYVLDLSIFSPYIYIPLYLVLTSYFISVAIRVKGHLRVFTSRLVIILIFALLQFMSVSPSSIFLYFTLALSFFFLNLKGVVTMATETKFWLFALTLIFGIIFVVPTLPNHFQAFTKKENSRELKAVENVEFRLNSYSHDAIKGTARTSMWKSSIPWIRDHWLLGSGLDTVKFMYPTYRRPEYGKLEGGHNFTPDRLHNEYLNSFATRGIPSTLLYYGGVILGWYLIMLAGFIKFRNHPYGYLIAGFLSGVSVYMGQVLFNFGVVATLVLFYVLMGMGFALAVQPDFATELNDDES